jgi:hypothetical protein
VAHQAIGLRSLKNPQVVPLAASVASQTIVVETLGLDEAGGAIARAPASALADRAPSESRDDQNPPTADRPRVLSAAAAGDERDARCGHDLEGMQSAIANLQSEI